MEGGREGGMREAGQGRGDGDEQIMKRLGWSGREGEKDGIKAGMEVTVDMITCMKSGGQDEEREGGKT